MRRYTFNFAEGSVPFTQRDVDVYSSIFRSTSGHEELRGRPTEFGTQDFWEAVFDLVLDNKPEWTEDLESTSMEDFMSYITIYEEVHRE